MTNWAFRFATATDAQQFAEWATGNPDIPRSDIESGTREQSPTATYLIVEEDGKVILCVPAFAVLRIAYLLFNPDADAKQRVGAMNKMRECLKGFAAMFGINRIETLSREGYAVAEWAEKHGFEIEDRQLFTLTVGLEKKPNVQ